MSLRSPLVYQIPEETVRVAQAAFPKSTLYLTMQAELGMIYTNTQFASLFSATGQPALDPARLALILVFQFLEGLSDRQAAEAVRSRIDWKYALALELTDPGFDASALSEFRQRLIAGAMEELLLTTLLTQLTDRGIIKARGTQRTDSTHILAAVRSLNRLELLIETVRHALNRLAAVAPTWLHPRIHPDWADRYSHRAENFRLPKAETARQVLASQVGADGFALLTAIDDPTTPVSIRDEPAVIILRRIWWQQFYGPSDPPQLRPTNDAPPSAQMIKSPYDDEARYSIKRETTWTGYKLHVTETCDPAMPRLVIDVQTTPATIQDDTMLPIIQMSLQQRNMLPTTHLVDAGYTNVQNLHTSQQQAITLLGPVAADPSWQARSRQGFDHSQFVIDWERQVVTCPEGKQSLQWRPIHDDRPNAVYNVPFSRTDCRPCPSRDACTRTKSAARQLTLGSRAWYTLSHDARTRQQMPEFKAAYARRAGVESLISQSIRVCQIRRSRYIGRTRTHLQHLLMAVAINLLRLAAWWHAPIPTSRPQPPFTQLVATG